MRRMTIAVMALGLAFSAGCSDDNKGADDDGGGVGLGDGAGGVAGGDAWSPTNQPACAGAITQCNDGKDNEDPPDGLIDERDPECVGPCDDDESSFATGIPGDNVDCKKQDCFFDGNSGQGEGCEWNLGCDPNGEQLWTSANCKGPYKALEASQCETTQSEQCKDVCLPLTPNGCDCFGCCTVFVGDETRQVFLGSAGCTLDALKRGDTTVCAACTPREDCTNGCGECELCLGKTVEDLPASCFGTPDGGVSTPDAGAGDPDGGPDRCSLRPQCDDWSPCVPGCRHCLENEYCTNGCCISQGLL